MSFGNFDIKYFANQLYEASRKWLYDGSDLKTYLLVRWWGPDALAVGPTGVYLLDFFCSGIQFYLLLSPYLCFISLLNLDLYVLGDDSLNLIS